MDLYGSFVRILFDPDVTAITLLGFGDDLWSPLEIDGAQIVQEQAFVRAAGIKAFPRGNERTSIRFEKSSVEDSVVDAFAACLDGIVTIPKTQADIIIGLEDGRQWRISDAAIRSWPAGHDARLTRQTVEIIGGAITADVGTYTPLGTWG